MSLYHKNVNLSQLQIVGLKKRFQLNALIFRLLAARTWSSRTALEFAVAFFSIRIVTDFRFPVVTSLATGTSIAIFSWWWISETIKQFIKNCSFYFSKGVETKKLPSLSIATHSCTSVTRSPAFSGRWAYKSSLTITRVRVLESSTERPVVVPAHITPSAIPVAKVLVASSVSNIVAKISIVSPVLIAIQWTVLLTVVVTVFVIHRTHWFLYSWKHGLPFVLVVIFFIVFL